MFSNHIPLCAVILFATLGTGSALAEEGNGNKEAALAVIQPYFAGPSAFPVTEPLKTRPTGKRIAMLDCGAPVCGLFSQLADAPAKILGMEITHIKSGTTADGVAAAFDTVLAGGFDGVLVPAIAPSLWSRYLDQLHAAKIPVVTTGIIGVDPKKVAVAASAEPSVFLAAKILANWAVAQDGPATNVVFYNTPELSFSGLLSKNFVETMRSICTSCIVRVADIPVAGFGSSAPTIVVDDLLAHPDTTAAVFAVGEQAIGLSSALSVANVKVRIALNSPDPSVLATIQQGKYDVGLGADLTVLVWTLMDSLARLTTGQEPSEGARADLLVRQLVTSANLKGNVEHGWTGYPDFADRFQALWAQAK